MLVRTHRNRDIPAISRLYYDTIHRINVQDYSREQVDAWAPEVPGESFWRERFKNYTVYVAEDDGCIVGFTELGTTGHIDCFFVHHDWQRCGVGTRLMKRVMTTATRNGISRLNAEVSITAAPFFRSQGFVIVKEKESVRGDVKLKQFDMEKWLAS